MGLGFCSFHTVIAVSLCCPQERVLWSFWMGLGSCLPARPSQESWAKPTPLTGNLWVPPLRSFLESMQFLVVALLPCVSNPISDAMCMFVALLQ
eukprot:237962-Pelagomonas_calceolata.AAC.1